MSKFLIVGAGGFIGGHLISRLLKEKKHEIRAVDLKPLDLWFQKFDNVENFSLDMQEYENCIKMSKDVLVSLYVQRKFFHCRLRFTLTCTYDVYFVSF